MSSRARCRHRRCPGLHGQAQRIAEFVIKPLSGVGVFFEESAGVVSSLADSFPLVAKPGAGFFHDVFGYPQIDEVAFAGNAFAVKNIEFSFAEWRCHFILHYLGPCTIADDRLSILDGAGAANIHTHRAVELQSAAPVVVSGLPNITPIFSRI